MRSTVRSIGLAFIAAGLSSMADAAVYTTDSSTIAWIDTYTQYGSGDIIIHLTSNSLQASCPYGFWISESDAGGKAAYAAVLAAFQAGKSIVLGADTSVTWSGGGSAACRVWDVVSQ